MQRDSLRQHAAWLTMVSLLFIAGLRAKADDLTPSKTVENASTVELQEIHLLSETDDASIVTRNDVLVVADSPASSGNVAQVRNNIAVLSTGQDDEDRVLHIDAFPVGDVLTARPDVTPPVTESDKYWIGVQIADVTPALRSQLDLEEGRGVLIGEVLDNSPASKAGIKRYDILLTVNGVKVSGNADLLKAIQTAEGKELKLTLLRAGSERSLTVTPAERPKREDAGRGSQDGEDLTRWIQKLEASPLGTRLNFNVVQPGQALALPMYQYKLARRLSLPEGLSISITREGTEPARITIKQQERVIETTEDKRHEIPDDLRQYVESMLNRGPGGGFELPNRMDDVLVPAPPGQEQLKLQTKRIPPGKTADRVGDRLRALEERFEKLERAIRERDDVDRTGK